MQGITAVCRECHKRFELSRRSNQHHRASGSLHRATRFCSRACKQAAYRKRNAGRPKSVQGTIRHATVTRPLQNVENVKEIRASKTILDAEIYTRYRWEDRASSDGMRIMVAELRPSALVRR